MDSGVDGSRCGGDDGIEMGREGLGEMVGAKLSFYDDVEEEEVNKEFGRETLDKFVEVEKLEENRKYAFSKTQFEVSGRAGAQV